MQQHSRLKLGLAWLSLIGLYSLTLTQIHTFDAYSYATAVQAKPWRESFHPHHLLYGPLGEIVYWLSQGLGYRGMAFGPLQMLNVLAGASGVIIWWRLLQRLTNQPWLATSGSVLVGGAYAWWYYAVEVEVYTLAGLFLIIATGLLIRLAEAPKTLSNWRWLGLAHSAAILFHQTNVLWLVPVLAVWLSAAWGTTAWQQRWQAFLQYAMVGLLVVGGSYAIVMFGLSGFRTWPQVQQWLFEYANTGLWGTTNANTFANLLNGWQHTIHGWLGGAVLLASLGLIAWRWRLMWRQSRMLVVLAATWLITYSLFFGWWEPDNIEFWIACLPPWALLITLSLHTIKLPQRRWWQPALSLALVGMSLSNGWQIYANGAAANDQDRQIVTELAKTGTSNDFYFVPNGLQALYAEYEFERPNSLPLSVSPGDWQHGCLEISAKIVDTTSAGYTVWLDQQAVEPSPILLERYGLEQSAVAACFAPFLAQSQPITLTHARYLKLDPIPQGLPDWHWQNWSLGWRENFITASTWGAGWTFIPQQDPHLLSPRINLASSQWRSLEITMASTLPNQHGQLYWMAPGEGATEDHSISWDVIGDGALHTYTLDLSQIPTWQGPIGMLRLDPVVAGAEQQTVTIQRLRLLP
ncbi:MAG: DUF2723 domain-containing protein [Chloroflexi bacterium]|nr:DUF2723 domain-containing protein [Chloroflexota bacterium]